MTTRRRQQPRISHDPADALGILAECLWRLPPEHHQRVTAALRVAATGGASMGDLLRIFEDASQTAETTVVDLLRGRKRLH